ncbi:MAG: hypothetical protein KA368_21160, partial [Acidobacteria bacterium]|nr:hypothetical protein [Acidobacteriota bacterium]
YFAHWIVLFKFENDGFYGHDPYFKLSKGKNPHSQNDLCKKVLIHINNKIGDYNFPHYSRTAICLDLNTPLVIGKRPIFPLIKPPFLPRLFPIRRFGRPNEPFSERSVRIQMQSFGLFTNPPCNQYLAGTNFGVPRLVRRLDVIGRDYYLIPMLRPDGSSAALVRVDAPTGQYLDSLYYSESPLLLDNSQERQHLIAQIKGELPNKWKNAFTQQINEPLTEMLWLPCGQSLSAFSPFYVIEVKALAERFLVRLDGGVFQELNY